MAKDKITDYDAVASNNLDVGGISVAEGMLPSGVNNAMRELMSHQKEAFGSGTPLYVDQTNNRLGINQASPAYPLHVGTDDLIVDASGDIRIGNGQNFSWGGSYSSGYPTVYATTGSGGFITFAPNGNSPSTNQVRIVGEGIEFGAASSNLDDYEEGTWTPAIQGSVTNPTVTAQGNSTGRYVKIGNIVHFWFYDSGTTITNAGSGFASVGGLPYTNESGYYPVFQYLHGTSFTNPTSGGYVSAGTNNCIFIQTGTTGTVLWATGTTYMMISGTYKTA